MDLIQFDARDQDMSIVEEVIDRIQDSQGRKWAQYIKPVYPIRSYKNRFNS